MYVEHFLLQVNSSRYLKNYLLKESKITRLYLQKGKRAEPWLIHLRIGGGVEIIGEKINGKRSWKEGRKAHRFWK